MLQYFVVDCRPLDQFSAGHFHNAFHLDASLVRFIFYILFEY